MKTQALKGMRDLLPNEQTLRDYIQGKILETYRASGFERISTPMLEDMENLDKSDGGDNLNLIFKVLKRGDKLTAALNSGDPKELSDMPLAGDDPSGSNVEKVIARTAVGFVLLFLVGIVVFQVGFGVIRRANTANLSENANVRTVASALRGGVEWGNGFTQFPEDFSVQEADENTGRIEVTVTDTSSEKALECFAGSQVQATAFAVNALLNPKINTVVYHVNVHMSADGEIERTRLFGFLRPTGDVTSYMTFVWTKTQSANGGVNFGCTITGINDAIQDEIRDQITTSFTPVQILTGK